MKPVVLTIAGFDGSGGAGIQADLRTIGALGCVGLSVVTAVTVQNSTGMRGYAPVQPPLFAEQLDALLSDYTVDAIKIGMLGDADHVLAVALALEQHPCSIVILDPVFEATRGPALLTDEGIEVLMASLMPLATMITPNVAELHRMTGMDVETHDQQEAAARALQSNGAQHVLVTGGDEPGDAIERLYTVQGGCAAYIAPHVDTPHTHGTGCLASTIVACRMAWGDSPTEACDIMKGLITRALNFPVAYGSGQGYPDIVAAVEMGPVRHSP